MYYLQSRYYNSEHGRFINADGLIGQVEELLCHNMFAYCGNNPINMADPSGYMYYCPDWASPNKAVAAQYFKKYNATHGSSGSTVTTVSSGWGITRTDAAKAFCSVAIDGSKALIKGSKVSKEIGVGTMTMIAPVRELSKRAKNVKLVLGKTRTIGITIWDTVNSIVAGEYYGAGVDIVGGAASLGAGIGISFGAEYTISTLALVGGPAVFIGALAFGLGFGIGLAITAGGKELKNNHYGR